MYVCVYYTYSCVMSAYTELLQDSERTPYGAKCTYCEKVLKDQVCRKTGELSCEECIESVYIAI